MNALTGMAFEAPASNALSTSEAWSTGLRFDTEDQQLTLDHKVSSRSLVPAAVFLMHVALELRERFTEFTLHELQLLKPLYLEEMHRSDLHIRVQRASLSDQYRLQIATDTTVYLDGFLSAHRLPWEPQNSRTPIDIALSSKTGRGNWYSELATRGNDFGKTLQLISTVDTAGGDASMVATRIAPSSARAAVLDACFHSVLVGASERSGASVLQSIETLYFDWSAIAGATTCEVMYRSQRRSRVLAADLRAADAHGKTWLYARNVVFVEIQEARPLASIGTLANFTIDPLGEAVSHLGAELGIAPALGPYNQIWQSLLSPQQAFAAADLREIFLFIRFQSWWKARPLERGDAFAAAAEQGATPRVLPNGLEILELNRYETDHLYREIFDERTYISQNIELSAGDVVLDVGANIGLFSLSLLDFCPGLRVFALEPSPITAAVLAANVQGRGDIFVDNRGVAAAAGSATFRHYLKSTVFSGYETHSALDSAAIRSVVANTLRESGYTNVSEADLARLTEDRLSAREFVTDLTSISDIISEQSLAEIAFLKIDAEKSELAILRGIREEHWPLIRQIAVEVHGVRVAEAVHQLLRDRGFETSWIRPPVLEGSELAMIVARRITAPPCAPTQQSGSLGLAEPISMLVSAIQAFRRSYATPLTILLAPESESARSSAHVLREHAMAFAELKALCGELSDVRIATWADVQVLYPIEHSDGSAIEQEADLPYSRAWYGATAAWLLRTHLARTRRPHKVIAVDCDDTLWEGGCAEADGCNIRITGRHRALQEWLVNQRREGMLICLSSKNEAADVLRVLQGNPGMVLKPDDIACSRIAWAPKSQSLMSMAEELNLGLDSFIFIDDNPVECAEVSANAPGVVALRFPADNEHAARFLKHIWAFDSAGVSSRTDRTAMHRAEQQRRSIRRSSNSFAEFLATLQMRVSITAMRSEDLERVSELTQRTNQFNLNAATYSVAALDALMTRESHFSWVVRVSDRFGDYGKAGAILACAVDDCLRVNSLLLSCRVLGRGVEAEVLKFIARTAASNNLRSIVFCAVSTGRNTPALQCMRSIPARTRAVGRDAFEFEIGTEELLSFSPRLAGQEWPSTDESPAERTIQSGLKLWDERYRDGQWLERVMDEWSSAADIVTAVWSAPAADESDVAGRSVEERVAAAWEKALGRRIDDWDTSFFEAGGTSLKLVYLLNEISRVEGCAIALSDAYLTPTVRGVSSLIASRVVADNETQTSTASAASVPLSGSQLSLWFLYLADRSSEVYNVPLALILSGPLNKRLLRQTLATIVERESALNTTFQLQGRTTLARRHGEALYSWAEQQIVVHSESELIDVLTERAAKPIDLVNGPIVRAELLSSSPDRSVLLIVTHHIAADFQSMCVLVEELARTYEGLLRGVDVATAGATYEQYVKAQADSLPPRRRHELETFWSRELADAPAGFFTARASAGRDTGAGEMLMIPRRTAASIAAYAAQQGITRFTLLIAAYGLFLARQTRSHDVVIGTPVSLRSEERFSRTVGNFVNLVPLRLRLEGCTTLREAILVARDSVATALAGAELPSHTILRQAASSMRRDRVVTLRTTLALHERVTSWPATALLAHGRTSEAFAFGTSLSAQILGLRQQAGHCDLALDFFDFDDRLGVDVKYSTLAHDRSTATELARRFVASLDESLA